MKVLGKGRLGRKDLMSKTSKIWWVSWEFLWEPRAMWVGCYWDTSHLQTSLVKLDLYLCVVPCFPLHIRIWR